MAGACSTPPTTPAGRAQADVAGGESYPLQGRSLALLMQPRAPAMKRRHAMPFGAEVAPRRQHAVPAVGAGRASRVELVLGAQRRPRR